MDPGLVLYDAPGSPCARRVRITLLEKGLPWRTVIVDLSRMEQKKPEYLRLNPNGVVPTLVHGERVVYESNVITEYLDEVFPDVRLYPEDPWERAQVKLWQSFELSFAKDYRPMMYQRLLGPIVRLTRTLDEALETARRSTTNPFDLEWERKVWGLTVLTPDEERDCAARLYERVDLLEQALSSSDFLVGGRFTQAEISVFPRLRMYPFVQLPITAQRYPRVAAWMARLERRSSFEQSLFEAERGMQRLGGTSILPWIAAKLKKPRPSTLDRAGLAIARQVFRRATAPRDDAAMARRQASAQTQASFVGTCLPDGAPVAAPAERPPLAALTLYESPLSPSSRRVQILLRAYGLSWASRPVDLAGMEQKSADFLRLNPSGEVPVLVHGERTLCDSALISEYLDLTFGGGERPSFLPADAFGRAQARMWVAYDQAVHKEWRPLLFHSLGVAPLSAEAAELFRRELCRKLERVEAGLVDTGFLVGRQLTVADIAWFSRVEMFPRLGMPIEAARFPAVCAWMERLRALSAFAS